LVKIGQTADTLWQTRDPQGFRMWPHCHFTICKGLLSSQKTRANILAGYWKYYCLSETFPN